MKMKIDWQKVIFVGSLLISAITAVTDGISKKNFEDRVDNLEKALETLKSKKL